MAKKVEEFMEIGGSPIPGITLHQILRGPYHVPILEGIPYAIRTMAWSPNGSLLASAIPQTRKILLWNTTNGELIQTFASEQMRTLAWLNNQILIAASEEGNIYLMDITNGKVLANHKIPLDSVHSLIPLANNKILSAGSNGIVYLLDLNSSNKKVTDLITFGGPIYSMVISPDHQMLAIGGRNNNITIWNLRNSRITTTLKGQKETWCIAWSPDGKVLVSGSNERTVYIWDLRTGQQTRALEAHTDSVNGIGFLCNGKIIASKSNDHTVRFWNVETSKQIAFIKDSDGRDFGGFLVHPSSTSFADRCHNGTVIRIWEINESSLFRVVPQIEDIHYTTAKLVLVGDSGVGKTGLGWRLAHNEFKEHSSTHGQQFWVVPELKQTKEDGTECEAVLWDLAGQHIYRSVHSIFLDNVDASLILFDPTNRQEPLKGVQFWLEQLKGKKQLPPSVLVGARLDRGAPVLSQEELEQFCQRYEISGGYIGTSARSGQGLDKLLESIKEQIPWDQMTTTVTTVTFKRIKDYVLKLKEDPDRRGVLVRPDELRKQLQVSDKDWQFTDAEMMTAVGHLANHGYVTILKSSSGQEFILLVPELLASVASSIFLNADKHPRELGAMNENDLLQGKYPIEEIDGLKKEEQQILLDATVVRFLEHNICFREFFGSDNLLIFPSLIKQKRPLRDDVPATDDISYIVRGRVENIYATLVVLLGYTPSFNRINQWQNQAQYETGSDNICGFRLVEDREGEIELILYHSNDMPEAERNDFQALFEKFLYQRDVAVTPFPPVACSDGHRLERATVVKRLREGKKSVFCDECGLPTALPDLEAQQSIGIEASDWLKREEAIARLRSVYETYLVNVKGYRRNWAAPRCYISYIEEQKEFADRLAHDLSYAGVFMIDEVSKVKFNDIIIIVDSDAYQKAWKNNLLLNDARLIKPRLAEGKRKGLISINQIGFVGEHDISHCVSGSFCDPTHYVVNLFDLVLNLYAIPLSHAGFMPLRQSLHQQWEQTLAQEMNRDRISIEPGSIRESEKEIYVSYAWGGESEKIVNEIDQAFQSRGVMITRDKRDLGYRGSIKEFMERIGHGQGVVVIINDKYLKSKNCMFELIQIAQNKQFNDRIFPVVLSDANIYDAVKRLEYVSYWENKITELDTAMKSVNSANLQGFREEIDLFDKIRDEIASFTDTLQNMNTLTPEMHRDSNFQTLYDVVMKKLEE